MNLIVYGSLINKKELEKENINLVDVEIIKVYGFKRVFNQEPSYRFKNSIDRAVLNVQKDKNSWFNAILIKNLSSNYFDTLDIREKGYNRNIVSSDYIETYCGKKLGDSFLYMGKEEKRNHEILPNLDYLDICLNGVKTFDKEFLNDFLKSTYKNSKDGLTLI